MPKYLVIINRSREYYAVVEAANEDVAREFAEQVDHDLLDNDHIIDESIKIKDAGDKDAQFKARINKFGEAVWKLL